MSQLALADYVDDQRERILHTLMDWLRIPSISAQPDHMGDVRRSAEFAAGVTALQGERGRSVLERIWTRPTAEVVGIEVGYTGPGIKTVVPAAGTAKISFRLVPDQDPEKVATSFGQWLEGQVPQGVPDDGFHAPNERMVMDQFWKGLLAAGELWLALGRPNGQGASSSG